MARTEAAQTGERAQEPEPSAAEPGPSSPGPLTGKALSAAARKGKKCEHPSQSHPKLVTNLYHWITNTAFKLFHATIHCRLQLECWKGAEERVLVFLCKPQGCRSKFSMNKLKQPPQNSSSPLPPGLPLVWQSISSVWKRSFYMSEQERRKPKLMRISMKYI